uniref:Rhamnosyl transferase n=1 Tax=Sphingomonas sp. ATCC 53159 TaxID=194870 RepID=B4XET0_9SPHN|nr:rhamnosyl transferase [Sphingomonas sp. ATCC 53159]
MQMLPTPDVSILVVAFNSTEYIEDCLRGIAEGAGKTPHEVLLIDNGDGRTEALVRQRFHHVRIVPSEGNIGFGAGNNRLAAQAAGPLLLLVNPDAIPQPGAIDQLVTFAKQHPEAAAWGGRSYSPSGDLEPANFMSLPTPADFLTAIFNARALRSGGLQEGATTPGAVEVLNGGFMMVRTDVWQAIGGFDESFFLYSEEIDLFQRIRTLGHKVLVDPSVKVVHNTGSGQSMSQNRLMYLTTGRMHYARKHFGALGTLATGCALWLIAAKYTLVGAALWRLSPRTGTRYKELSNGWRAVFSNPGRWWSGYPRR